jgi:hypothetical protein
VVSTGHGPTVRARILSSPRFRPGDTVDLGYIGGPTPAYTSSG